MIKSRLKRLEKLLDEKFCDAMLVTKIPNVRYFSNFRGDDSILIVTPNRKILVTDFRYLDLKLRGKIPEFGRELLKF